MARCFNLHKICNICDYTAGLNKSQCKHEHIIGKYYGIAGFSLLPENDVNVKQTYMYIATGKLYKKSWFKSLTPFQPTQQLLMAILAIMRRYPNRRVIIESRRVIIASRRVMVASRRVIGAMTRVIVAMTRATTAEAQRPSPRRQLILFKHTTQVGSPLNSEKFLGVATTAGILQWPNSQHSLQTCSCPSYNM